MTFFGTGTSTGVPVIGCQCETCTSYDPRDKRLRTSALVEIEDGPTLLIDAGPDFRYQMLRSHTKRIDAILITHKHYDHMGGLDDVRGLNYTTRNEVSVFAQPNVAAALRRNLHYAFAASPYPGAPKISLNEIATETFEAAGVEVTTLPVIHGQMPITGFRIGPLAYVTDASQMPEETIERAKGVDTLVLNALGPLAHPSHFNLDQAIEVAQKIGARQTYFTHISHKMPPMAQMEGQLPEGMQLAYDELKIKVGD